MANGVVFQDSFHCIPGHGDTFHQKQVGWLGIFEDSLGCVCNRHMKPEIKSLYVFTQL